MADVFVKNEECSVALRTESIEKVEVIEEPVDGGGVNYFVAVRGKVIGEKNFESAATRADAIEKLKLLVEKLA